MHNEPDTGPLRTCERCGAVLRAGADLCPECGQVNSIEPAADAETDATLVEPTFQEPPGPVPPQSAHPVATEPVPTERFAGSDSSVVTSARRCTRCQEINELTADFCFNCGLPFERSEVEVVPGTITEGAKPAGFWIRLGAIIVDWIILLVLGSIIWPVIFGESFWQSTSAFSYLFVALYVVLSVWRFGATLGKNLLGISIVDGSGNNPSLARSTVRFLATYLSAVLLLLGHLMAAFRKDKRALHDLIAGTYVVQK
jgi:uncharacterized RDD family membrane protein YckC/RNA polymerase subunit RPABC4/transcription elongation factor Spt4